MTGEQALAVQLLLPVRTGLTRRTGSSARGRLSALAAQRPAASVGNGLLSWQWSHAGLSLLQRSSMTGSAVSGRKDAPSQTASGDVVVFPK